MSTIDEMIQNFDSKRYDRHITEPKYTAVYDLHTSIGSRSFFRALKEREGLDSVAFDVETLKNVGRSLRSDVCQCDHCSNLLKYIDLSYKIGYEEGCWNG